jgi:hypothetical protein
VKFKFPPKHVQRPPNLPLSQSQITITIHHTVDLRLAWLFTTCGPHRSTNSRNSRKPHGLCSSLGDLECLISLVEFLEPPSDVYKLKERYQPSSRRPQELPGVQEVDAKPPCLFHDQMCANWPFQLNLHGSFCSYLLTTRPRSQPATGDSSLAQLRKRGASLKAVVCKRIPGKSAVVC